MAALAALGRVGQDALRFDRSGFSPLPAARCALAVAGPLGVGLATGRPVDGLTVAVGALSTGFATFQGVYRTRAAAVLLAAVGMAVATFVGAVAAGSTPATTAVVAGFGFAAGMLIALGQAASVVGLQWVVALLVVGQFTMTPSQAAARAGLVLAGGMIQLALVVGLWPLRRFPAERRALATAYRELADYAVGFTRAAPRLAPPTGLEAARAALADPQPFAGSGEGAPYRALLDEAERIRRRLVALAVDRRRALGVHRSVGGLDRAATATALVADRVATVLDPRRRVDRRRRPDPAVARQDALAATRLLSDADPTTESLAGALRAALRLADSIGADHDHDTGPADGARTPQRAEVLSRRQLARAWAAVTANLVPSSAAFRHAVRLAAALASATVISRAAGLPRAYWMPLTALIVLKPDFGATFGRGLSRVAGTLLGAAVATGLATALHPRGLGLAALIAVFAWSGYALFRANYALFSGCITATVVLLLSFVGVSATASVADRVVDTLLGGALALALYAVWPTWAASTLPAVLARHADAVARYSDAVLLGYAAPPVDRDRLRAARAAARLARSNAEATVDRVRAEPRRPGALHLDAAVGVLTALRRHTLALVALDTHLMATRPAAVPTLAELSRSLPAAVRTLATGLGGGPRHPPALLGLRPQQLAFAEHVGVGPNGGPGRGAATAALLIDETDALVDSVDTALELLAEQPVPL